MCVTCLCVWTYCVSARDTRELTHMDTNTAGIPVIEEARETDIKGEYYLHPQCHNVLLYKMLLSNAIFKSKVTTHPSLWLLKPTDSFYQTGRPWRSDYANTDPPPGSNNDWLPRDTGRGSQQPCSPPVRTQNNKTNVGFCRHFVLFMYSIYVFMCKCVFVSTM